MTLRHRVSVVIPAFNAEQFVADAIRSIHSQEPPVEVIVVDDGSTDRTADAARNAAQDVRVIRAERNEGPPSALNRGLEAATTDLIGFLDADDLWAADRLAADIALLRATAADLLWGRSEIVFQQEDGSWRTSSGWPAHHYPALGAMLFDRRVFDEIGTFNRGFRHAHDIDLLQRAEEAGLKLHRHDRICLTWRRHGSNMTNNIPLDRDYLVSAVRAGLHRRRALRD